MSSSATNSGELAMHYHGYRVPGPKFFKTENVIGAINYMPKDGDVVLCGYPKTGTTWTSYIIYTILHNGETYPSLEDALKTHMPQIEYIGVGPVDALKPPRFYKTHLPYRLLKINEKAKYVYTYRKPDDTIASSYSFYMAFTDIEPGMDTFFRNFLNGKRNYGDYFDHLLEIYPHKDEGHILMVSYEDLKQNTRKEVLRIAKFLGGNYYNNLSSDETLIDRILKLTSFDHMKKTLTFPEMKNVPTEGKRVENFFRKGVVGDGKKSLNESQLSELDEIVFRKMGHTEIYKKWKSYDSM